MVLVTDKQYPIDGYLKSNLDFMVKRLEAGFDNLIIIDGAERMGKSNMGKAIGYYIAWCQKKTFTCDNIFFDPDELFKYATTHTNEVIMWDESALAGMAEDWQGDIQKKLIKMLITCGKFHHTYIFIIPKFSKLREYIAVDRSLALIRVYSKDKLTRGSYRVYSQRQKAFLYHMEKKRLENVFCYNSFHALQADVTNRIVDEVEYEKKKDAGIELIFSEKLGKREEKWKGKCSVFAKKLVGDGYTQKQCAKMIKISEAELHKLMNFSTIESE